MKFKIGDRIKVIAKTKGARSSAVSGCPIGPGKIIAIPTISSGPYSIKLDSKASNNSAYETEMEFESLSAKDIEKQIESLEDQATVLRSKIKWMEANKVSTFNDEEYRIWSVLEALERPDQSRLAKAKLIKKIIDADV